MADVQIRSLAQMKRVIATAGVQIRVLEHWRTELVGTSRTPIRIQTNCYTSLMENGKEGWNYYPKVEKLRFNGDGSVTFYPGERMSWRLAFAVEA